MAALLFATDQLTREYAVVIVRTGRPIYTSPDLDLAKAHLRSVARDYGDLEVREIVTKVESRRAYRPRRAPQPEQALAGVAA